LLHTHEEANIMGAFFSRMTGTPHLYDMHSSLVQQMANFQFTRSKLLIAFFRCIERVSLRNARSVIVICKALYDYAATITESEKLTVIENFIDDTGDRLDPEKLALIKEEIGSAGKKIILYAGTLEPYQGIPLLLEATGRLDEKFRLVLIGGKPQQVEELRAKIAGQGLSHQVLLLGQKPPGDIPYYIQASHVLVSPRVLGTNIPLKIYSFLKSGIPVVATNLYTHTQSVTPEIAILVEPTAQGLAQGIETAVSDAGRLTAQRATGFCRLHYTYQRYLDLVNSALDKTKTQA
jgi:glycosyltransferase involved in cell wall biosynthesis